MSLGTVREVTKVVTAHRQTEGAGFVVRRPLPTLQLKDLDPFLLLDEMGPVDYAPGEAVGAPDHPHRGFETVTYVLAGEFEHEDSAGHRGVLGPGDVQWMTAGAGIVHSEMPSRRVRDEGGRVHGFQIWVNLPAKLKLVPPRYQEMKAEKLPQATSEDGKVKVRVVAGEVLGARAVIDTNTPIVYFDFTLEPGADLTFPVAADHQVFAYVFGGQAELGEKGTPVADGQLGLFGKGEAVRLRSPAGGKGARLLVLGGVPIGEPVARYGPFVMNTPDQLADAFRDYQSGKLGSITRTARVG